MKAKIVTFLKDFARCMGSYMVNIPIEDKFAFIWLMLSLSSIMVAIFPSLSFVSKHGKIGASSKKQTSDKSSIIGSMTVPKAWFSHLYIMGSFIGLLAIILSTLSSYSMMPTFVIDMIDNKLKNQDIYINHSYTTILTLIMFLTQCFRRLFECYYVSHFGLSRIHISGYIAGLFHYFLLPISILLYTHHPNQLEVKLEVAVAVEVINPINTAIAIFVFNLASWIQHTCHVSLSLGSQASKIKSTSNSNNNPDASDGISSGDANDGIIKNHRNTNTKVYHIPDSWQFEYVCCPHYTSEIIIYISICLFNPTINTAMIVCWVTCNLTTVAKENMLWYKMTFPEEVKKRKDWKAVIPFFY